jgi:hypothetical protein
LSLIFGFLAIGKGGRFCGWDNADERVNKTLLMIGDSGFPNLAEPMIFVDLAGAVDKFYSPGVVCTGVEVDLVEIYFDFLLVKDKLE